MDIVRITDLLEKRNIQNINQIKNVCKVTVSSSVSKADIHRKLIVSSLFLGAKPVTVKVNQSIATFGVRRFEYNSIRHTKRKKSAEAFIHFLNTFTRNKYHMELDTNTSSSTTFPVKLFSGPSFGFYINIVFQASNLYNTKH